MKIEKETREKVLLQGNWGKVWARLYIEKQEGKMTEELEKWAVDNMTILYKLLSPKLERH